MLERLRIVLVRPIRAGNVGAVCRAMTNLGLRELVLVSPACDIHDEEATNFALRGRPLLERARVVESIADALNDAVATFASSGKGGMYRKQAAVDPRTGAELALSAAAEGVVAVAFGPEDRGLLQEELLQFDRVIEIPTDPGYPAMNLAAAVTVIAYELRMASLAATPRPRSRHAGKPATDQHKRVFFEKLFNALERIGYFRGQKDPAHLKYALRRIFGRTELSEVEVDVLIGMAQQIDWAGRRREPE